MGELRYEISQNAYIKLVLHAQKHKRLRCSPSTSTASKFTGLASHIKPTSASRLSSLHKRTYSRFPVELGGALSLMPLHSVTLGLLPNLEISLILDSLQDVKSKYVVYESILFGKVKGLYYLPCYLEGIDVAASHPLITSGVAIGFGSVVLKSTS
ncbi:hypothetical protein Patl1_25943 [Pistacia atlantica]|uniref:Uncharacterized protein n=1 Tax=Pistacia atlantica TaxID=434234 RepID=A0ACC1B2J6_9ROSI|nr:hypothetical protein Patl1_25943 [Pistacia atlantica]